MVRRTPGGYYCMNKIVMDIVMLLFTHMCRISTYNVGEHYFINKSNNERFESYQIVRRDAFLYRLRIVKETRCN